VTRIGVLTGLAREAAVVEGAGWPSETALTVAAGGAEPARTRAEAQRLAGERPDLLVSFGLAGGLDPAYRPGALVLPGAIVDAEGGRWPVAPDWHGALLAACPDAHRSAAVVGVDTPVTTPAAKRALAADTGAAAVDMESVVLARVAAGAGLPLLVVRAVCDPAERSVPGVVQTLLDAQGRVRWHRVPAVLPHLRSVIALAMDSGRATRSLRGAAAALAQLAKARPRPTAS
jgi:adenosylhomocysteine nucleosidase